MKSKKIIKFLGVSIILIFLCSYFIETSGYYEYNLQYKKNLTQAQLAEILGISLDAIKKIESGQTQYPSSKVLKSLSEVSNIDEIYFIGWSFSDIDIEYLNHIINIFAPYSLCIKCII